MRKILAVVAAAGICLALGVGSAQAITLTNKKAIGWYDLNAPIGGAYWFNERVGVQAGIGFSKVNLPGDATDPDVDFAFTAAVPIRLAGPETCHFLFRPGVYYETNPGPDLDSFMSIRADLAVEYFLSHHFSIVGGSGLEFNSANPSAPDVDSTTQITTRGITLGSVGLYYYFGPAD